QRCKRIGRDQSGHFRLQEWVIAAVTNNEQQFGDRQLHKNNGKNKKDSRVLRKTLRLVDPKLGDRSGQNQQSNKKILRQFRLFATKDEKCETVGKHRKD